MRVLVACEFSGIVREAFRKRGHDAWSCDLLDTEIPGNHIKDDVLKHLDEGWDLMIAHPPCTYLCRHRARWNNRQGTKAEQKKANEFFMRFYNASIKKICIENPIPLKVLNLPCYSQIIQPWQFGHDYSKKTCLWLKGLPILNPTKIINITYYITPKGNKFTAGWYKTPRNSKDRSRTFTGIAEAMAEQWGNP
jgi:hypothetical protein